MDLKKRKLLKDFATWLDVKGYLTDKHVLIPYELAELFLESDFCKDRNKNPAEDIGDLTLLYRIIIYIGIGLGSVLITAGIFIIIIFS